MSVGKIVTYTFGSWPTGIRSWSKCASARGANGYL